MELFIYKGFGVDFLKAINDKPLVESTIENKIDVRCFDVKTRKKIDANLVLMEDDEIRWLTYEEYTLIKDRVALAIKDYGLKVTCFVNNIYPDCYPIEFDIEENVYYELKRIEEDGYGKELSEVAKKINDIYSAVYFIEGKYYGTFFNFEYDKESKIETKFYYPTDIRKSGEKRSADIAVLINDDIEAYLKTLNKIITQRPQSVSLKETNSQISRRIASSLRAYCLKNDIVLLDYYEELQQGDAMLDELIDIAQNDLRIPDFKAFRNIKFYKNPDFSKETIEISQAQIIKEIITQAEKAFNNTEKRSFRDVFITASTGAGKSIMFQIPAVYLAKKYKKLTIIIEPVIALMEDQKAALIEHGYNRVAAFNSNLISQIERENVLNKIKEGEIDLLYLSPETLLSYSLETIIGDREVGLLIVDEAHIVTTWGVGFRPDYWYLGGYINNIRNLGSKSKRYKRKEQHFPICAFTATAINGGTDDSVNETIISLYMENPIKYIGYARRDDITFDISIRETEKLGLSEYEEKKAECLSSFVRKAIRQKEKTIVYFPYATTARDAKEGEKVFAKKLDTKEIGLYTGGIVGGESVEKQKKEKQEAFEKFRTGEYLVMFATKAFGMGVDINDIKNVYHYAVTGNLCDYVQEIGRAARKSNMTGVAVTDYYWNDLIFSRRLFGMSQIRQFQIHKVLSGVYDFYKNKMSRSFLISPESFTYIFAGKGGADGDEKAINKLKTCLLMLEKDFYDKYSFKVLISRPQSIFTKAFVVIDDKHKKEVLNSQYQKAFKYVCEGRKEKPQFTSYGTSVGNLSDIGDIYSVDLKEVWETYYPNISFPQFKYWFFSAKTYVGEDKIEVLKEIQPYIFTRQLVKVKVKNDLILSDLKEKILRDLDFVADSIHSTFGKNYFTLQEFAETISKEFGMSKARIIANSVFELVDPKHAVVKPRKNENMAISSYSVAFGTFKIILLNPILKSKLIATFCHESSSEYSEYLNLAPDSNDSISLKLLSIFEYISYEIVGGEQPEIYIRLNDPQKIKGIVNGSIKYSNSYVAAAREKLDRDVKVLNKFFLDLPDDTERWNYIENYFLGEDVVNGLENETGEKRVPLKKMIDASKSFSTTSIKSWADSGNLFDNEYKGLIGDFEKSKIPMPDYFHTVIKNNLVSDDPIMAWVEKNILIFGENATQLDLDSCKIKGWKVFKAFEIDLGSFSKEFV